MTEDEKLLERLLVMRFAQTPGTARDLAMDDFNWIKKYGGAKPAVGSGSSGSPTELSRVTVEMSPFAVTAEQAERLGKMQELIVARLDPEEIKRMNES